VAAEGEEGVWGEGIVLRPLLASSPTRSGGMSIRVTTRSAVAVGGDTNSGRNELKVNELHLSFPMKDRE